jgi:hypothetical protein
MLCGPFSRKAGALLAAAQPVPPSFPAVLLTCIPVSLQLVTRKRPETSLEALLRPTKAHHVQTPRWRRCTSNGSSSAAHTTQQVARLWFSTMCGARQHPERCRYDISAALNGLWLTAKQQHLAWTHGSSSRWYWSCCGNWMQRLCLLLHRCSQRSLPDEKHNTTNTFLSPLLLCCRLCWVHLVLESQLLWTFWHSASQWAT